MGFVFIPVYVHYDCEANYSKDAETDLARYRNASLLIEIAGTGGTIVIYICNFLGFLMVVLSLAEMSSIAPTAGGQYHWTSGVSVSGRSRTQADQVQNSLLRPCSALLATYPVWLRCRY